MNKPLNLSDETIETIYNEAIAGIDTQRKIGKKYGISNATVSLIKRFGVIGYRNRRDGEHFVSEVSRHSDKSKGKCCNSCGIYFEDQAPGHPRLCNYCGGRYKMNIPVVDDRTDKYAQYV